MNFLYFSLLEKGRQILMKDNLIDEERAKQEEAAQETLEQKLDRLGMYLCACNLDRHIYVFFKEKYCQ